MIYIDSSALLKLLFAEAETGALASWLEPRAETPLVASALVRTEVPRATRRVDPAALSTAEELIDGLDLVPITTGILDRAASIGTPNLRTLDAIHLASAELLGSGLTTLVAYDRRLLAAAQDQGVPCAHPGVQPGSGNGDVGTTEPAPRARE